MMIVLLGYMGSGKSSIGQLLANKLNLEFHDLDEIIEDKEGLKISEIFKSKGEIYFRKKETEYLKDVLGNQSNRILALGGGTPCYGMNMDLILKSRTKSVYLRASVNTLFQRLRSEKNKRPLISHLKSDNDLLEYIGKHLFERQKFYNQAQHIVSTDQKSIPAITEEILKLITD